MGHERNLWGWGWVDSGPDAAEIQRISVLLEIELGIELPAPCSLPLFNEVHLRPPGFLIPAQLKNICSGDKRDRMLHTFGQSLKENWFRQNGRFHYAPDYVAKPRDAGELRILLDFAQNAGISVKPVGGGTSPGRPGPNEYERSIAVSTERLDRFLFPPGEAGNISDGVVSVQAGIKAGALTADLQKLGFYLSPVVGKSAACSLGGWLSDPCIRLPVNGYHPISKALYGLTIETPQGTYKCNKTDGNAGADVFSGAALMQLALGSRGLFGIITEVQLKLKKLPAAQRQTVLYAPDFEHGLEAVQALTSEGLQTEHLQLVSLGECRTAGLEVSAQNVSAVEEGSNLPGGKDHRTALRGALLFLKFTGDKPTVLLNYKRALDTCAACQVIGLNEEKQHDSLFNKLDAYDFNQPYLRDHLLRSSCIFETLHVSVTWAQCMNKMISWKSEFRELLNDNGIRGHMFFRIVGADEQRLNIKVSALAFDPAGATNDSQLNATGVLVLWSQIKKIFSDAFAPGYDKLKSNEVPSPVFSSQKLMHTRLLQNIKTFVDPNWILSPGPDLQHPSGWSRNIVWQFIPSEAGS